MAKYIALAISFFSIYLATRLADYWMISFAVIGYFIVVFAFILDASSKRKPAKKTVYMALYDDELLAQHPHNAD
ncbi:hypothetical protein ACQKP8_16245 [Photobacterium alginatilyticum]|uniref:hypothetical protein n=1 Tax=Photobacterium alginatilyticum TaxID=1775171 RepID=UPI0040696999